MYIYICIYIYVYIYYNIYYYIILYYILLHYLILHVIYIVIIIRIVTYSYMYMQRHSCSRCGFAHMSGYLFFWEACHYVNLCMCVLLYLAFVLNLQT